MVDDYYIVLRYIWDQHMSLIEACEAARQASVDRPIMELTMKQAASGLLRSEHREVENHLDTLLYALKHLYPERLSVIRQSVKNIWNLVGAHMDIEERIFYPAIRSLAEDLLPNMLKQHDEIREAHHYWGELLSAFPEPPTDRDMAELYRLGIELHDAVQVHIVDEEEHLLKLVDKQLSIEQQQNLLAAMQGGTTAMSRSAECPLPNRSEV
jgi:hemerythrin-like domain-containing protein